MNQQAHSQPNTETQQVNSIDLNHTPSHAEPQVSRTHPLPPPEPVVSHTQGTPSLLKLRKEPPLPPKVDKPHVEVRPDRDAKKVLTVSQTKEVGKQESRPGSPETEVMPVEWPPPYEPSAMDALTLQAEEEIMDLPDLPPPPFFYPEHNDQSSLERGSPCLGTSPETQRRSPSPRSASPLVTQIKPPPKPCLRPPTSLDLTQKKPPPSKPSPPCALPKYSTCSPRLPPQKPTKFPVSLCVPVNVDRRPSNTSQYDNLSEADEDGRYLERLLDSTTEEILSMNNEPQHITGRAYDPVLYPLPPPPLFIPPSPSPVPPLLYTLPSLPQEPEYEGGDSWVKDSIIPPPPPTFSDRLTPFQCSPTSCSDTHRATSPGYSKPFARGPRDHSAFPAPLLYTGSPPTGHSRPSGQSTVGVTLVRSSPDFCRMPPGGQQLPKSVTF